jgi:rSAM/selenodomain-associated transferase 1
MRCRKHLVVMARTPRLGTVKRRLARDIGALAALRFYRGTLRSLLYAVGEDPRWTTWLALTPDPRGHRPGSLRTIAQTRLRIVGQGGGDLGARMGRFLRDASPGPVVIVGTDIPDLGAAHIARAFAALGDHDWVFGPAADGGYWLIGAARRRGLPRDPFAGVRWSSAHALSDTVANLEGARIAYLEELADIDTGADLARHRGSHRGP